MALDIYVTSLGESASIVLNSIATFFSSGNGDLLKWMMFIFGSCYCFFSFLAKTDFKKLLLWPLAFVLMVLMLIDWKKDIVIHESINPLKTYPVDNVPFGIAFPLSVITSLSQYVTEKIEGIMNIPGEKNYEQNGMIWGSTIYKHTRNAKVNTTLLNDFSKFFDRCVWPNIKIRNTFTFEDLANSNDIFNFLKTNTKNGYGRVFIKGANPNESYPNVNIENYPKCRTALIYLEGKFKEESDNVLGMMSKMNTNTWAKQVSSMRQNIENTYDSFFNMSTNAQSILMQNLAINSVRDSVNNLAVSKNAMSASLNYTNTQGKLDRAGTWVSIGMMAQEYIPMLHTILMLIIICGFIPVVYMALFPTSTINIIKIYIQGLIWISIWPLFFIFIDFIMNIILSSHLSSFTEGLSGISLSNIDPVEELTWRYASLSGFLLIFTPYIAKMITVGAGNAMMSVSTSMMQQVMHDADKGAVGMSQGTYNLGNLSVGNTNMNNIGMDKFNIRPEQVIGGNVTQSMSGATLTTSPMGQTTYDTQPLIDNQPFNFNSGSVVSSGLSLASKQSFSTGLNMLNQKDIKDNISNILSNSESSSVSSNLAQSYNTISNFAEKYGHDVAHSTASDNYYGLKASAGLGASFGKFLNIGGSGEIGHKSSSLDSIISTNGINHTEAEAYNQAMQNINNTSQSDVHSFEQQIGLSKGQSISASFNQSLDQQQASNYAKNNSFQMNTNLMPEFKQHLIDNHGEQKTNYWLSSPNNQNDTGFKQAQTDFVKQNSQQYTDWYKTNSNNKNYANNTFQKNQDHIQNYKLDKEDIINNKKSTTFINNQSNIQHKHNEMMNKKQSLLTKNDKHKTSKIEKANIFFKNHPTLKKK